MPATHLVSTDFPAPLSPQSAVTCPSGRSRSTADRACTGPKCLSRPRTLNSGSVLVSSLMKRCPCGVAVWMDGAVRGNSALAPSTSCAIYEVGILAAAQTLAPTVGQIAEGDTKLSLITVSA